jgi:hypothetical protein
MYKVRPVTALPNSVGIFSSNKRYKHNPEIQTNTPVLDIPNIEANALIQTGVAAPPVDLRPSGHSGKTRMARMIMRNLVFEA